MIETEIIERDEYLDKLYLWWERTKVKGGMTTIIKGEAGIGKTVLINRFLDMIKQEKPFIFRAEGFEEEMGPLASFIESIRRFFDEEKDELTTEFLIRYATNLSRIIPGLYIMLESVQYTKRQFMEEKISSYIPTKEMQTFFDVFTFFEALSRKRPVVLFIDDVQWLDPSSRKLLYYFIGRVYNSKILILVTYRTHFITSKMEEEADEFLGKIETKRREHRIEVLELAPIEKEHCSLLITTLLRSPHKFTETEIDFLYSQTEGNPKFMEELLSLLRESEIILKKNAAYIFVESPASLAIPSTIENTIKSRLNKIYDDLPQSKELLEFASAIGLKFSADRLEGVTDRPLRDILEVLAKIERKYYLVKRYQKIVQYIFDHKKTQEVIYYTLGNVAPDIHRRVAVYLENEKADSFSTAYHYEKGLSYRKADKYFYLSALEAFNDSRVEDAIVFFEKCISLETNFLNQEPSNSLLLLYSESLFISYKIERALQILHELYGRKHELEETEQAKLNSLIGKCYYTDGRNEMVEKSFDYLRAAIGKYSEIGGLREAVDTYFDLSASYDHIGAYELAKSCVDKALDLAEKIKDPIALAIAFRRSYISYYYTDFPEKLENAIIIFEECGDKRNLARLLNNLGVENLKIGDIDESFEYLTKSLLLFEEEHAYEQDIPVNNLGVMEIIRGNFEKARNLLNTALNCYSEEYCRIAILTNLAFLEARKGNQTKAKDYVQCIMEALQHFLDPRLKEKCLINTCIIYYIIGENEMALNFIIKALSIDTSNKKHNGRRNAVKSELIGKISEKIEENKFILELNEKNKLQSSGELPYLYKSTGYLPCLIAFYH